MSYILEALKKSEQERQQGGVPSIQSVHKGSASYDDPDERENGGFFKLFLLSLVFVIVGGAGFILYERECKILERRPYFFPVLTSNRNRNYIPSKYFFGGRIEFI